MVNCPQGPRLDDHLQHLRRAWSDSHGSAPVRERLWHRHAVSFGSPSVSVVKTGVLEQNPRRSYGRSHRASLAREALRRTGRSARTDAVAEAARRWFHRRLRLDLVAGVPGPASAYTRTGAGRRRLLASTMSSSPRRLGLMVTCKGRLPAHQFSCRTAGASAASTSAHMDARADPGTPGRHANPRHSCTYTVRARRPGRAATPRRNRTGLLEVLTREGSGRGVGGSASCGSLARGHRAWLGTGGRAALGTAARC